jgi:hypothetical protein
MLRSLLTWPVNEIASFRIIVEQLIKSRLKDIAISRALSESKHSSESEQELPRFSLMAKYDVSPQHVASKLHTLS